MPLILGTNSIKDTGYDVANSLRFNSGDSPYLTRTISSGADVTQFTFSFWCKRSKLGGDQRIYSNQVTTAKEIYIRFNNNNTFTGSDVLSFDTNQVFRDVSAWYHFHFVMDSTQSTESDRFKMHVNGVQVTDFNSPVYPSSSEAAAFLNTNEKSNIGYNDAGNNQHFDGYLTEVVLLQGVAEPYTSFGEFDEDSPTIWKPKDVSSLSRGTNGFYLDFEDSSSLGNDQGGSVNLTPNNLAATDQSTDTCTNNFATMNPLANSNSNVVLSEGNLFVSIQTSWLSTNSTIGVSKGKWYAEVKLITLGSIRFGIGKVGTTATATNTISQTNNQASKSADGYEINHSDGNKYNNNSNSSYGSAFSANDIGMIAFDADNGTLWFGKNGTWFNSATQSEIENGTTTNSAYSGISMTDYYLFTNSAETTGGGSVNGETSWNFGSPAYAISSGNSDSEGFGNFEYAVPSGYFALCSKNLAEYG